MISAASLTAQNLIPNSGFECGVDDCSALQIPPDFGKYACQWICPTGGTTDVFSVQLHPSCYANAIQSSSTYSPGRQQPHGGNRMAGIYTYYQSYSGTEYREYLEVKLNEKLIPGEYYHAEMYVSLGDRSYYASAGLGMAFVNGEYKQNDGNHMPLIPVIVENTIIMENVQWLKIEGTFQAAAEATHLVIGNFYSDSNTNRIRTYFSSEIYFAYYFIDDVSVERVPYSKIRLSGDLEICAGEATTLNAAAGTNYVVWSALNEPDKVIYEGTDFKVQPPATTTYKAVASGGGITVSDTIRVTVHPNPIVFLGNDTTMCAGERLQLDGGINYSSYQWQGGVSSRFYEVTQAGTYRVSVENQYGCTGTDEITVRYDDVPYINLGRDTVVCDALFKLKTGAHVATQFEWSDGSALAEILPRNTGIYWLTATNHCGSATDSIKIFSYKDVFIPNVVTTNGDQLNEFFQLGIKNESGQLLSFPETEGQLKIINRWGEEILSEERYKNNWPSGEEETGLYFYHLVYPGCNTRKGWVQVIK